MQYSTYIAILATLLRLTASQKVGTYTTETHPSLSSSKCTSSGCTTQSTKVVLDSNWRWLHTTAANQYTNCYTGSAWNTALCPDPTTCATNCALDGADYTGVYGIASTGTELTLKFVTTGTNKNVGSRVYLMENDTKYQMINPLGGEFTFDVSIPMGLVLSDIWRLITDGGIGRCQQPSLWIERCSLLLGHGRGRWCSKVPQQHCWCQVRYRILRCPVPPRYQVHQRRGKPSSTPNSSSLPN